MTAKKEKDKAAKAGTTTPPVKQATKKAGPEAPEKAPAKAPAPGSKKDLRQQIDAALASAMTTMQPHFKEKEYAQLLKKAGKLFGDALQVKEAKAPAKKKAAKPVAAKKKDKQAATPAAE